MTGNAESALKSAYGLHRAGQFAEAARLYGEIIRAEPRNGQALYLLGYLHYQRGEYGDAERLMGDALALNPNGIDVLYNRALALMKLRRAQEALALLDRLLALNPGIAEAWHARGMALTALARDEDAVSSYGKALLIRSAPETLNNRANALFGLKRFAEAAADYEAILTTDSKFPYARGSMAFSRLQSCDWRELGEERERISSELRAGGRVVQPGAMLAISASPEDQLRAAGIWVANEVPASPSPLWRGERYSHERIRLAYVSADFCSHAAAYLIAGVMEAHDRNRFEVTAIALNPDDGSAVRAHIAQTCEHFIDASGRSDAETAALIRNREADIAVDLMGFTGGSRMEIFAARPAPVQTVYLGFPGTTGAPFMDYLIADPIVVPEDEQRHYRETIAYMPNAYLPCEAVRAMEGSVLWLSQGNPVLVRNLKREAGARGVHPERLIFAPFLLARADHLARLRLADIVLDTLPYGGHATALDALSAGVPVLTSTGTTFAGRVAASLVSAAGVPELAAGSLEDYERIALSLATDIQALAALKAKLGRNRETAALFDIGRYTSDLEAAYTMMWQHPRS